MYSECISRGTSLKWQGLTFQFHSLLHYWRAYMEHSHQPVVTVL